MISATRVSFPLTPATRCNARAFARGAVIRKKRHFARNPCARPPLLRASPATSERSAESGDRPAANGRETQVAYRALLRWFDRAPSPFLVRMERALDRAFGGERVNRDHSVER